MIYLDNAATTLHKPPQVGQAMLEALGSLGNSARGLHGGSLTAAETIYAAREKLAALFHCSRADHVIFTANVTQALNTAIGGLFNSGDHLITTDCEHNSVLRPLYRLRDECGVHVDFIPADRQGRILPDDLESRIRPETKAVICAHASNLTGNLAPLSEISAICKRYGLLLIVDAAQTAGAREIDMQAEGIDVLCFTGHKGMMGPQGTGGLCVREGLKIRPMIVGGTGVQSFRETQPVRYPTALEAGTLNGHGIAGLSAAVDFLNVTGIEAIHRHELNLTQRFFDGVCSIPGVKVYGDFFGDRAAIVALNIRNQDSGAVADRLWNDYGIAVRSGAHCAPRLHLALGTERQGAVRFSFSWFTTESEIDAAVQAVREIASE